MESSEYPFKVVHYRGARHGDEGFETDSTISSEDISRAVDAIAHIDVADEVRIHLVGNELLKDLGDVVRTTVARHLNEKPENVGVEKYLLQGKALREAIEKAIAEKKEN